jgi:hypothetical protein
MALFDESSISAACADGDVQAIRDLCSSIRVALRDRPGLGAAPVRAGGGLGDSDAANFAYRMLRACQRVQIAPPAELVDLFQILLKQDRGPLGGIDAIKLGAVKEYLDQNPNAGINKIERETGVSKKTILRWREAGVVRK